MAPCEPNCECKWCMICKMITHPMFQDTLDQILTEFKALDASTPRDDTPTTDEIETEEC